MPNFCRHGRFLERCPICSKTLPGHAPARRAQSGGPGRTARSASSRAPSGASGARSRSRGEGLKVRRETRQGDDGYRSELVPGLRSSADARHLAREISFAAGRLVALAADPPGLYGEAWALGAAGEIERATWLCMLIAYLSPLEGEDPFAGIRMALAGSGAAESAPEGAGASAWEVPRSEPELPGLQDVPLGPRSSHDPARGSETLAAYLQWVARGGTSAAPAPGPEGSPAPASQADAFTGDPDWTPERRFERVFERLALPGFGRMGRYELLLVLGRLGLYDLRPGSLHLGTVRGSSSEDPATVAAKRVFGIGDPILLERRAKALAEAIAVPVEALDLALYNWAAPERATVAFPGESGDPGALERAETALGV
jgi:hypothetical protein